MTSEAFAKAVTEMVQTLYRVSCSQLSVGADREDAVQETLRKAWEKRASLKDERYLHTWVIRILLNVCHDIRREGKRMIPAEEIPGPDVPSAEEPVDLKECLLYPADRGDPSGSAGDREVPAEPGTETAEKILQRGSV